MIPSFIFSALDDETLSLSKELQTLGGGDAIAKNFSLYTITTPLPWLKVKSNTNESQILWYDEDKKTLGLRDAMLSSSASAIKSMKYYRVDGSYKLAKILSSPNTTTFPPLKEISSHALDGFNVCLIGYGERASGKTISMFGPSSSPALVANDLSSNFSSSSTAKSMIIPPSMILELLTLLYDEADQQRSITTGDDITIALSSWIIKGNHIIDLMSSATTGGSTTNTVGPLEFASIHCSHLNKALQVLAVARSRATGVLAVDQTVSTVKDSDRAHFFLRVIVYRKPYNSTLLLGTMSHIHICDLIGSPDGDNCSSMIEADRIARRETLLQLQSFLKVLSQMKSLSKSVPTSSSHDSNDANYRVPPATVTAARDSKLTSVLAPLIQGNTMVYVLAYLREGEQNYNQTLHTLNALSGVNDIVSACYRTRQIPLSALKLRSPEHVLSPFATDTAPFISNQASVVGVDDDAIIAYLAKPHNNRNKSSTPLPTSTKQLHTSKDTNGSDASNRAISSNALSPNSDVRKEKIIGRFQQLMDNLQMQDLQWSNLNKSVPVSMSNNSSSSGSSIHHSNLPPPSTVAHDSSMYDYIYDDDDDDDDDNSVDSISKIESNDRSVRNANSLDELHVTLSKDTVHASNDIDTLKGGYASLLQALSEEHRMRQDCIEELRQLREDSEELLVQREIVDETHKADIIRLNGQIRTLMNAKNVSDVFDRYESDLSRLMKENEVLRERNLTLESRDMSHSHTCSSGTGTGSGSGSGSVNTAGIGMDSSKTSRQATLYRKVVKENEELRRSIEELHLQQRRARLSIKVSQSTSSKLRISSHENEQLRKTVADGSLELLDRQRDVTILRQELHDLLQAETWHKSEREKLLAEVATLRARFREADFINRGGIGNSPTSPTDGTSFAAESVPGLSGLSDAPYMRVNECKSLGEVLNSSINSLHNAAIAYCPTLLPLCKKVAEDVMTERSIYHQQKQQLLQRIYRGNESRQSISNNNSNNNDKRYDMLLRHSYSGSR